VRAHLYQETALYQAALKPKTTNARSSARVTVQFISSADPKDEM